MNSVDISFVIVSNMDRPQDSLTYISLRRQSVSSECIIVENKGNTRFSNAAAALNYGGAQAKGRYIAFAHQDVDLESEHFIERCLTLLDDLPDLGVAGLAGVRAGANDDQQPQFFNRITHGIPPRPWGQDISVPMEVQTLDEFCLIVPRAVFVENSFDAHHFDGWHLYGVDFCLSCVRRGLKVYALPLQVYHQSDGVSAQQNKSRWFGSLDESYFASFETLRRKHKGHVGQIHTSCASFSTTYPVSWQRAMRRLIRSVKR